ncbi:sulfite reductase beta subunit [Ophiocordyceps camponoti-floridani]|uniref:Sulfite reductase beta subunit n=1 Tax=Ophiocordyceps camponoti-floridani TaxID=2030778 RepID=A0A8H4QB97_9HYPO|nr:sulfite reductase beta subunit [Ophiocordyceps camponoti-floridani]
MASSSSTMAPEVDTDASDPVTATYQIYLNPALPRGRRLLVLQQPNRVDEARPAPRPTEVRLKSDSGMVEVQIPLDTGVAYDREKGLRWGRSLQASMAAKNGGSHGLAGGFGLGAVNHHHHSGQRAGAGGSGRAKGGRAGSDLDPILDWNDAVLQDKVLRTQTLGGQWPEVDDVEYMVGVFRGKELHLTPVSSHVLLRPELPHIDAIAQQERSAASAASKDAASGTATAARAIHMTIKTATDGDAVTTETMADRLRFVQAEPWRSLRYVDENDEAAWDVYNESLFVNPPPVEDDNKGKLDPAETSSSSATAQAKPVPAAPLSTLVPRFVSQWDDKQLLEAVSGITKPEPEVEPLKDAAADERPIRARSGGGSAASRADKGKARASASK